MNDRVETIALVLIVAVIMIGMLIFVSHPVFNHQETFANFLKQKSADCDICLQSQYTPCNVPDKECWILIDNIHQACYQNCTVEMEN